jgi:hypothetical protein
MMARSARRFCELTAHHLTVPIENIICLGDDEIERVEHFVTSAGLAEIEHKVLFECSFESGQSFITPDKAQDIADELYRILPNACVIFIYASPVRTTRPALALYGQPGRNDRGHL